MDLVVLKGNVGSYIAERCTPRAWKFIQRIVDVAAIRPYHEDYGRLLNVSVCVFSCARRIYVILTMATRAISVYGISS
jgi:hypothetical protein